jgi:copper ion binding protein
MTTSTYAVTGMTCEHCVRAVSEEVRRIEGVSDVTVDLPSGALTISSSGPVEEAAVAAAVEEAGYQLAAR